ncbi:MarR family winged helix-turn-helix transcriptional regulator [Kitasatospora sp. NPDC050543]|uniref:MarR family winged helix-turn-helix transcriptional regulator n=1 Tax=Kitasatospora sp. NPDC050543 TaxID=3364054 RepID=UPI00378E7BDB
MYDGRKGSSSPLQQTVHLLVSAGRTAELRLTERLAERGMRPGHLSALSTLAEHGPHAKPDLAARIKLSPAEAGPVLDDLLSSGFVETIHIQADRRHEVVMLTAAGRQALDNLHSDAAVVQDDLLSPLTKGERAQLNALLHRVCALAARGSRTVPAQGPARWKGQGRRVPRRTRAAAPAGGDAVAPAAADPR